MTVQTRNSDGALFYFATLEEALKFANDRNNQIWKISFPFGPERVRLIWEDERWVLEQMIDAILVGLPPFITIHIVREQGHPLCNFSNEVPGHWPFGHIWIRPHEYAESAAACADPDHVIHSIIPYHMCNGCEDVHKEAI